MGVVPLVATKNSYSTKIPDRGRFLMGNNFRPPGLGIIASRGGGCPPPEVRWVVRDLGLVRIAEHAGVHEGEVRPRAGVAVFPGGLWSHGAVRTRCLMCITWPFVLQNNARRARRIIFTCSAHFGPPPHYFHMSLHMMFILCSRVQ